MPSPPLAPDDGPIDIGHLERMTLGDAGLEREVLAMFSAQAVGLIAKLAALPADSRRAGAHLKGSARAIGAFRVADAAESLEARAAERRRSGPGARRAERCRGAGARGDRRNPAPVLIPARQTLGRTAPQVFAATAGAERIDPL